MPIEFLGMGATNDGSETNPRSGGSFDKDFTIRLARAHQDHSWDRVLTAYGSGSPDPAQAAALIADHTDSLQILVAFRPIIAATEDKAWEKAYDIVRRIEARKAGGQQFRRAPGAPENTGSQRLLEIAARGERHDAVLYTGTAKATGGAGNSNALVGTPEQVAGALLRYVDLGVDILSARGYDTLQDAIDFGDQVIPLVRQEVSRRESVAA